MVMDAPFFKEAIKISKFSKKIDKGKKRSWLHMDGVEAFLSAKK